MAESAVDLASDTSTSASVRCTSVLKVGINGFGRIGRMVLKATLTHDGVQCVAVNDPFTNADYMAYELKYDSTHGRLAAEVLSDGKHLTVNDNHVHVFSERDPGSIPWSEAEVDYVIECTGLFLDYTLASKHLKGGAKRVLLSAPSPNSPMFVLGVNHRELRREQRVISNASCTTNCLAPVLKVLHEAFGIEEGLMTTIHSVTINQKPIDGITKKDFRYGRGGFQNIIPTSTKAAAAVGKVYASMRGKMTGTCFRVPVANGSVMDLTVRLSTDATYDAIKKAVKSAADGELKGIVGYSEEALVSQDIVGDPLSCVFDATAGLQVSPRFVKVICWYDNECGYANRIVELAIFAAKQDAILS